MSKKTVRRPSIDLTFGNENDKQNLAPTDKKRGGLKRQSQRMFSQKRIEDQNNPTMKSLRSFRSIAFKDKEDVIYKYPKKEEDQKKVNKADTNDCCTIM